MMNTNLQNNTKRYCVQMLGDPLPSTEKFAFELYLYGPELPFWLAPVSVSWIPGFSPPPSGIVPGPFARLPWPLLEPALMISPALALLAGASPA